MQQYFDLKAQYQDTLLFFQVGDFYELFFDDAKQASAYLAIALTKRGKNKGEDVPLCGVPVHALNHYLVKLIKGGFKVAICDQLTKPQPGTVVQRGITRVFTPATLTDATMLDEKSASYLLAFFPGPESWALLFGELMTAQLFATTIPVDAIRMVETELIRFFPDEIILPGIKQAAGLTTYFKKLGYYTTIINPAVVADNATDQDQSTSWVHEQFDEKTRQHLAQNTAITQNLELLHNYLQKNQSQALTQFKSIHFYEPDDFLILDGATQKNLELIANSNDGSRKNTLFTVLDHAKTPMGSRTIKKWIQRPLVQKSAILMRQDVVKVLSTQVDTLQQLSDLLDRLSDLERIIGRVALKRAQIFDYRALKDSLIIVPSIKGLLQTYPNVRMMHLLQEKMADFSPLLELLECSLNDDATNTHTIKMGYDHNLDRLRNLLENGQQEILKLEQIEIARTGISSLKISYTNISGYYIEVTNTHLEKVPDDYQHQQTLANRKRFVTPALKELERDLFKAQHELEAIQAAVFEQVKKQVEEYITPLRQLGQILGTLDALFGFATAAYNYGYTAPQFNDRRDIAITLGRHPIIEQSSSTRFTPNDTMLTDAQSTLLITGPNMGGKSTYLRQTALMCIMAQCGSFVPAQRADLPILDRVFTRIGSGDNLAEGKSTFLVEMEETATICTQATKNSLVILDEVGRGTSTYDGMALAQAIVEHIHTTIQARCLFATHYHELTDLAAQFAGIANYHTACKKVNDTVMFLHKVLPGVAEGSFGLAVAQLANLPKNIIHRARNILVDLHNQTPLPVQSARNNLAPATSQEPCTHHPLAEDVFYSIKKIDCSNMTPKQALDFLWEISEKIKE